MRSITSCKTAFGTEEKSEISATTIKAESSAFSDSRIDPLASDALLTSTATEWPFLRFFNSRRISTAISRPDFFSRTNVMPVVGQRGTIVPSNFTGTIMSDATRLQIASHSSPHQPPSVYADEKKGTTSSELSLKIDLSLFSLSFPVQRDLWNS